jgi:hypothetical protein
MLTKDILAMPPTTEWAVLSPRAYARKTDIKDGRITRDKADKVTLVSYDTYADTHIVTDDINAPQFRKSSGERTKRFLVTNGVVYYVRSASDFIDQYSVMEKKWSVAEAEYAKHQETRAKREAIRSSAVAQAEVNAQSTKDSIQESIKHVLGREGYIMTNVKVFVEGDWVKEDTDSPEYQTKLGGEVTIPYQQFMRLMEKFNELQDA